MSRLRQMTMLSCPSLPVNSRLPKQKPKRLERAVKRIAVRQLLLQLVRNLEKQTRPVGPLNESWCAH